MEFMKQKWSSGLVMGLVFTALVIGGCTKGDKSVSVSGPSAATFQPTGTIQGVLTDSVTQEPIVNAIVSIGVSTGTTDSRGQYVIANVPVTTDALNGTTSVVNDHYDITVDLRNVTSPVNMNVSTTTPRYPNFSYSSVQVEFTSLNDSNPCDQTSPSSSSTTCGNTNNTNHDTPVTGLVASQDMSVGKLDANISGTVFGGCDDSSLPDYYAVKAGYVVNLLSNGSVNSSTGKEGHIVGATTTDASGVFTFTNIEAQQDFVIQVMDSATKTVFQQTADVASGSDGATNTDYLEASNAIHVCPVNSDGPTITSLNVEPGADLAPNASETVTFTFSEPVDTSKPAASTDPSNQAGLVFNNYLDVNFDGVKSFVPFTATWNAAGDQLTVTFATTASSLYEVYLDVGTLTDSVGRSAGTGLCPNNAPGPWSGVGGGGGDCDVYFSTNGGPTPGTPVLTLVNAPSLDEPTFFTGTSSAIFDWPVVSGARTYNLYCSIDEKFADGTTQPGSVFLADSGLTNSEDVYDFSGFVESDLGGSYPNNPQVGIQYPCYVTGVNTDGVEGPASNIQTARDVIGPEMIGSSFVADDLDGDGQADTALVLFNEPLDETSAETPGNYTFAQDAGTVPTVSAAYLCTGTDVPVTGCLSPFFNSPYVLLTITQQQTTTTIQDNAGDTLTVSGVKDVNLNTIKSTGDVYNLGTGAVN